jgi:hypothetical protein
MLLCEFNVHLATPSLMGALARLAACAPLPVLDVLGDYFNCFFSTSTNAVLVSGEYFGAPVFSLPRGA